MSFVPHVEALISHLRSRITQMPEFLLEADGMPRPVKPIDYVVADLIGFEDELVDTVMLDAVLPVFLAPIPAPISTMLTDRDPSPSSLRTARFHPQNTWARGEVAAVDLPGWRYDMQRFTVGIMLVRYRRRS